MHNGCAPPLPPTRSERGKGRSECDKRWGRGGEGGEICGSVNHGKDAHRPRVDAGAPWIFVHEKLRKREIYTTDSNSL